MHEDIIQVLCDLEGSIDTNRLTYGGVNYWPLCRARLWAHLTAIALREAGQNAKHSISNSGPSFASDSPADAFTVGNPELGLIHTDPMRAKGLIKAGALSPDILFYLRPEEYRDKVEGQLFAKMLDSIYERADRYTRIKIELADPNTMGLNRRFPSLYLRPDLAAATAKFDPPQKPEGINILLDSCRDLGPVNRLSHDAIAEDMGKVFYFARLFEVVLKELRPKAICLSVYYHPVGMALNLAANRLGITTVDIQHGRLGPHHGLYTHLTAAPAEGYALLPDHIWCWGARTARDIDTTRNSECGRHTGIVGGNPWLDRWRSGGSGVVLDTDSQAIREEAGDKIKVLVSLQPTATPLPDFLITAMENAPENWVWWLRLHPLRRHAAPELQTILSARNIAHFEIEKSTAAPLFFVLNECDHHVTAFSSTALEALAFGKTTTLFDKTGLKTFPEEVKSGLFHFADTSTSLLNTISNSLSQPAPTENVPFIDPTPGLAEAALSTLLEKEQPVGHD